MAYRIVWSSKAAKQMANLDRSIAKRIYSKVGQLVEKPERYVERLVGSIYYKLRVGDYRIILDIDDETLRILILKMGHRSNVYDR
jgi:mRNA interferase RelE/StbE